MLSYFSLTVKWGESSVKVPDPTGALCAVSTDSAQAEPERCKGMGPLSSKAVAESGAAAIFKNGLRCSGAENSTPGKSREADDC